jgi:hypothetical protein
MDTKETIINEIKSFLKKEENSGPSENLVALAVKFVELLPEEMQTPSWSDYDLSLYGDSVRLFWPYVMDIEICNNGTYSYGAATEGWDKHYYADNVPIETPLPEEIIEWLKTE